MGSFADFTRRNAGPAIWAAFGGLWSVYGLVSGAYDLWTAGLPPLAWAAIGAAIFFVSVIVLLYRFDSRDAQGQSGSTPSPDPDWESKLIVVEGKHFRNCEVELDGHKFLHCDFENVTFKFSGGRFVLTHSRIGAHVVYPATPELARLAQLMMTLGHVQTMHVSDKGVKTQAQLDQELRITRRETRPVAE